METTSSLLKKDRPRLLPFIWAHLCLKLSRLDYEVQSGRYCDELGNIRSAAVVPDGSNWRAGLLPQRGEAVTGVDTAMHGPEVFHRDPCRLSETFRFDLVTATLVPKKH